MQTVIHVITTGRGSLRTKIMSDPQLESKFGFIKVWSKQAGRPHGWAKIHSARDLHGAINLEWHGRSGTLICRVVTKLGNGATSRLGGAILSAIGMTDWVAADDDQYVEVALRSTPGRLSTIRHELPDLIGQRCSPVAYTRAVEEAYRTMWEKHCGQLEV